MPPTDTLFEDKVQLYKNVDSVHMATVKIERNGYFSATSSSGEVVLEGNVRAFQFVNRGFGPNVGIQIYKKRTSFFAPAYEILFYDRPMANPSHEDYEAFKAKKKEFLAALQTVGAYSGNAMNVLKKVAFIVSLAAIFLTIRYFLIKR
jgi:hypothetical protein